MIWALAICTILLVIMTLLPLSHSKRWWVRVLDFPRLLLATWAVLLLAAHTLWPGASGPWEWGLAAITLGCLIYHLWWIIPYTPLYRKEAACARSGGENISILASNVLKPNRNVDGFIRIVRKHQPQLIITLETDAWWQKRLDSQLSDYPHTVKCPKDNLYGMHLYSQLPLLNARVEYLERSDIPSIHAEVLLPSKGRVELHCLHPLPPVPGESLDSTPRDVELIIVGRTAARSTLPVIVAGDLNDVAWSRTTRRFRAISGLLDPRIGRGMYNTFHARCPFLRCPLDHFFHSSHFAVQRLERLPAFGSDHFPILVRLVLGGSARRETQAR